MIIRKCDLVSPLITLYYKGETKHSSIFSGLISIILSICVFILCLFISFDFLFKKNPTSFYFITKVNDIGTIKLTSNYFFHYLTFLDDESKEDIYDERLFSVIGMNNASIILSFIDGITEYNFSHWKYERCENLNLKKINASNYIFNEKYFNFSLCLSKYYDNETQTIISIEDENFPYPVLENNLNKEYITNYGIIFKECVNYSLYNNNSCYDQNKISRDLSNIQMKYILNYYANFIDVENYKKPIEPQLTNKSFYYDSLYISNYYIDLHQTFVRTSDGILFNNYKMIKTYNIDDVNKESLVNYFFHFAEMIEIKMLNKAEVYHREYKKIQDIAGSVDGMIELIIFILEVLNNFFYHDYRLVHDFNEVIGEKIKKQKNNKCKFDFNSSTTRIINSKILINNFINNKKISNKFLDVHPKNFPSMKRVGSLKRKRTAIEEETFNKNHSILINIINNCDNKNTSSFQNITWFKYMLNNLCCFKNKFTYPNDILTIRKQILSEERLLKNYWKIKKIKEGLISIKVNNENSCVSLLKEDKKV